MAGSGRAVSCVHVCVHDDAATDVPHDVELEYERGAGEVIRFRGTYLPEESNIPYDVAVLRVEPPVDIPIAPLSLDDQGREQVLALGIPWGQSVGRDVPGLVFDHYLRVRPVDFCEGGSHIRLEVLHIDTRGKPGFQSDGVVRSGMSGGPILNLRTGTVVAIIEGRRPRGGDSAAPPEGYGIQLQHLAATCERFRDLRCVSTDPAARLVVPRYDEWPRPYVVPEASRTRVGAVPADGLPALPPESGAIGQPVEVVAHHGVTYVRIHVGEFDMGPPGATRRARVHEPFWMTQAPITVEAFGRIRPSIGRSFPDHPQVNVAWPVAEAYCRAVGGRLPTEIEWEYAARGGLHQCDFPWGPVPLPGRANHAGTGAQRSGRYPANGFGLFDMSGNVWEWCADMYEKASRKRVVRGGSWYENAARCTVWTRLGKDADRGHPEVGFRCVLP